MVQLLKQCGDDLPRENIMRQASHLDMELPLLLPGIRLKTTPTDLRLIKQMRLGAVRWIALRAVQTTYHAQNDTTARLAAHQSLFPG